MSKRQESTPDKHSWKCQRTRSLSDSELLEEIQQLEESSEYFLIIQYFVVTLLSSYMTCIIVVFIVLWDSDISNTQIMTAYEGVMDELHIREAEAAIQLLNEISLAVLMA